MPKERLDTLMYERGLVDSREKARRLLLAGAVTVTGVEKPKPGMRVDRDAEIRVLERERYVSRGGLKLEAALKTFHVDPTGCVCADIGASTGGFTDCLLQHGAAKVYAVDVGVSQLHERMRHHPQVVVVEHANARELHPESFPEPPSIVVVDVSFISLGKVLPALARVAASDAALVALVKPQFEATRPEVSKGRGVLRDAAIHSRILRGILTEAPEWGWIPRGLAASPIAGGSGNREYLLHGTRPGAVLSEGSGVGDIDIDALVRQTLMSR